MTNEIFEHTTESMDKSIDALKRDFASLRTGKVTTGIVDNIKVDYYGTMTALTQVGNVIATDATTISITPWEKSLLGAIEKAIQEANIGVNPNNDGDFIKLFFPPMTSEQRQEIVKQAKGMVEHAKVSIRNVRKDGNDKIKKLEKDKEISEDESKKGQDQIQKLTDEHISKIDIYVGGLPKIRTKPWEYKAVFSPADVIEEYTRPARLIESGKIVIKPPLTEIELLQFENIGTLEAFNSDGLRSLMFTIKAEQMREKTLRYPGYAEKIKLLSDNGFFNKESIDIKGQKVSPLEMTSKLLFDQWKLQAGEEDITVMRIIVEGNNKKESYRYTYDLYDEYDPETDVHSMARTTGYTATMAVRLLEKRLYTKTGITVPEYLGKNQNIVDFMLAGLKKRGVKYLSKIERI